MMARLGMCRGELFDDETECAMVTATAPAARVALLAGASGLVGQEILAALLADTSYQAVHSVGRRKLALSHPKLTQHVLDFKALGQLPAADEVYIALGTTIKVAGSRNAFRAVDFESVVALALAARAQGATRLGVVSAMGADPASRIFYSQVKGEMEQALAAMGFNTLVIARPAMLAGNREALSQPSRLGEHIGLVITRLFKPLITANYRSIAARDVAHALVHAVQAGQPGVIRLLSGALQGAGQRAAR
jgi:uncharacterized protein YbjT (DUF2867 family)